MAPVLAHPTGDFPELPYIIPRDGFKDMPLPPNADHPLGTLPDQYDIYYGLIWDTRRAFVVGISITLGRALIGIILGLISGYYKGILSGLILRVTDAFMSMPSIAAAALMFALFGELALPSVSFWDPTGLLQNENKNVIIIVLALILFGWMQYARLIRANVISEREREYVQAAKSIGAPNRRIIFKHILPNGIKGLYVLIASDIGSMVAVVSLFYFIGLIGKYPYGLVADWGQILSVSRDWIVGPPNRPFLYWYTYVPAISVIALFTISWSMVGDGLRELLDPRLSVRRRRKKAERELSFFTKWFKQSPQTQPQVPVYQMVSGLGFEIPPDESKLDPVLFHARSALKREDLPEALHAYTHLVWDGKNLGAVIRDLQAITWEYPEAVEAWSILGEALKQLDRGQEAQQAFAYYLKLKKREGSKREGNISWGKSLVIPGLSLLVVGLIFVAFGMLNRGLAKEVMLTETPTLFVDLLPPMSPTAKPTRALYLPTPRKSTATPTPMESTGTPTLSVQSTTDLTTPTSCIPDNPSQTGRVVEIINGNTVKVLIDDYVYVVRYIGIAVPDISEPNGMEAEYKNADLIYQKEITLIPDQTDKDARGRLLRYGLVGDTFVNYELVVQGFAQVADISPNSACAEFFQSVEQQAIVNRVGQWASSSASSSP